MTRGKHSTAVRIRREAEDQHSEIETYQRKIRELLAELSAAKEARATMRAQHAQQIERLAAQIREATFPAVTVAQREAAKLREERDHAKGQVRVIGEKWERLLGRLIGHAERDHRMTRLEAMEWVVTLVNPEGELAPVITDGYLTDFVARYPGAASEAVKRIGRARGDRH